MDKWIGEVLGLMHINHITQIDLANHLDMSEQYISMIFNCKKKPKGIEEKIRHAIDEIIEERSST